MARRRRSLIGKNLRSANTASEATDPEVKAEEAQATEAEEAVTAAPEASRVVDEDAPASPEDLDEAPTFDEANDAEDDGDLIDDDGPVELEESEDEPAIPHSGDPDSFAEAETQMDEYGAPDDPFAEAAFLEELQGGLPETEDALAEEAPTHPPQASYPPDVEPPPVQGALDDDPDLYGDFSELENPPTEEVSLYQDVSQAHNAPMNVPEPPPIPGIEDRFTPPPVERTEIGQRQSKGRPSYLATPTPASADREAFPDKKRHDDKFVSSNRDGRAIGGLDLGDDYDGYDDEEGPGMLRYIVGLGVLLLLAVVLGGGAAITGMFAGGEEQAANDLPEDHRGVKVRRGIEKEGPEILGDLDGVDDPDRVIVEPEPAGDDEEEEEEPVDEAPEPTPEAAPAPAPAVAAPAPAPRRKRRTEKAAVSKILIRANRRVLVYVDGKAVGYTPLDFEAGTGSHQVVAMVAGQPATRQTKSANIGSVGDEVSVEFSF